ncbi:MAG: tRNA (guanosine(18)-2'-O)-methyltransferase TrmH [Halioglobus sp.]
MTPERIARLRSVLNKRQPSLTIVTDFVNKQRNLSAIIRNADAVGVMRVSAVLGRERYKGAFRGTTMGSHRWIEVQRYDALVQALEPLKKQGFQVVAAHLSPDAVDYRELDYTRPTALLLGAERRGVSPVGQDLANATIGVPMVGMVGSYNVSVASGIILAEAQRQRQIAGLYEKRQIDQETYDRLFFEWGHPQIRDYCQLHGLRYPTLDAEGEIDNPSRWYAQVRAGTAIKAIAVSPERSL